MTTLTRSFFAPTLLVAVCLVAVMVSTGCSQDRHVFRSTKLAPKSVSIVSVETGNTLWTKEVPIGQQMLIDFNRDGDGAESWSSSDVPADELVWETWTLDARARWGSKMKGGKKLDKGKVELTGEVVAIKVDLLDPEVVSVR